MVGTSCTVEEHDLQSFVPTRRRIEAPAFAAQKQISRKHALRRRSQPSSHTKNQGSTLRSRRASKQRLHPIWKQTIANGEEAIGFLRQPFGLCSVLGTVPGNQRQV